jgi:hypothetical protein
MCDRLTGQKVVDVNELKCKCGCEEVVVRSYSKQHRFHNKNGYISVGIISCKKCGETLVEWSM